VARTLLGSKETRNKISEQGYTADRQRAMSLLSFSGIFFDLSLLLLAVGSDAHPFPNEKVIRRP
jgi:hypothetical protein